MKKKIISIVCLTLSLAMLFSLYSCTAAKADTVDLMENITAKAVEGNDIDDTFKKAHADFSAELFKKSYEGGNTLISPLSVMLALGMTGAGAESKTAEQFADLFGGIPADELNRYLYTYAASIASTKLDLANSVWINYLENFSVKETFLQNVADYYGADVFKSRFNEATVEEINKWIAENTDGMIEKMLDSLDPLAVMVLVNTVLFEDEWEEQYNEHQVHDGEFTAKDGTKKKVTMMSSSEGTYLEGENATGFVKPYANEKFAFAALLPDLGVDIDEFIASLDGETLSEILSSAENKKVVTRTPQFEYDFKVDMSTLLKGMGLSDAFSPTAADFTGIADNAKELQIHIGKVLHNTKIELTPVGTKAGAATVVEMKCGSAAPVEPPKQVYLDRPFVYMIIDTETSLPIFIGAVTDIGE